MRTFFIGKTWLGRVRASKVTINPINKEEAAPYCRIACNDAINYIKLCITLQNFPAEELKETNTNWQSDASWIKRNQRMAIMQAQDFWDSSTKWDSWCCRAQWERAKLRLARGKVSIASQAFMWYGFRIGKTSPNLQNLVAECRVKQ